MDKSNAYQLIKDTFTHPFDESKFLNFTNNLFVDLKINGFDWNDSIQRNLDLKNNVLKYKKLASYKYTNRQKLSIYIVKLKSRNLIANIRSLHGSVSKYFLDQSDSDSILIAYYSDDYDDWRFSFVKKEYLREFSDTGRLKVKKQISSVRRYSYLVGKDEPNHTAQSQLAPLLFI